MVRFRSKIDAWLLILLIVAVAGLLVTLVAVLSSYASGTEKLLVAGLTFLGVLLIVSMLLRTYYTVDDEKLRVVSGPFRWTIPISEIADISESRSALSSPALSLDRLKISYGRNRHILVSPADKKKFLKAIGKSAS